ncbi:MAG: hypothetical protein EOM12_18935 [Verrucomicrobiae bacterium]|nr:hypothetical protein [Verrucomicrobiae bacterium]
MCKEVSKTCEAHIVPRAHSLRSSWLGSMQGTGRIVGDILSPAEEGYSWKVLFGTNTDRE